MTPLAPCSTPFPYTTLFRSDRAPNGEVVLERHPIAEPQLMRLRRQGHVLERKVLSGDDFDRRSFLAIPRQRRTSDERSAHSQRDRKSTRLNSSHSQISYAVF